jgi:DNA-directed RNA polymerase specialized sigma24 family protein
MDRPPTPRPANRLDQITTIFQNLDDPAKFVLAYAPAIRKYFLAIVHNRDDAEEAIQDFLVKIIQTGFRNIEADRGRFRDYLKAAVRNAAITRLRQSAAARRAQARVKEVLPESHETADREWCDEWRRCVVERAWRTLENYQVRTRGNFAYTALQLVLKHHDEDASRLAMRASAVVRGTVSPEAFRKQLSRARRVFARMLLTQVAETLQDPSPDQVEDELADLGLMQYVRDFLPDDWRNSGILPSVE